MKKDDFKYLIIQAGAVDITNLNTKDNPQEYFDYFQQEAVVSATKLFESGEKAVIDNPNLQKVVIMNQIPRYDNVEVDPLSLKSALSLLFNKTLTTLWMQSPHKMKMFIGTHSIECSGAICESRYRHTKTGRFDGIHLLGSSGSKAYTESVLRILNAANITSTDYNYHLTCPQSQFQYQSRRHNTHHNNISHKKNFKSNFRVYQEHNNIHTQNRFEKLSNLFQGNW